MIERNYFVATCEFRHPLKTNKSDLILLKKSFLLLCCLYCMSVKLCIGLLTRLAWCVPISILPSEIAKVDSSFTKVEVQILMFKKILVKVLATSLVFSKPLEKKNSKLLFWTRHNVFTFVEVFFFFYFFLKLFFENIF